MFLSKRKRNRVKFNPGLSANLPSNNRALDYDSLLLFMIIKLQITLRTSHGELSFNNDGAILL